jgi:hypothetical protein
MTVAEIECTDCGETTLVWNAYEFSPMGREDRTPTETVCESCFLDREYSGKTRERDPTHPP